LWILLGSWILSDLLETHAEQTSARPSRGQIQLKFLLHSFSGEIILGAMSTAVAEKHISTLTGLLFSAELTI